MGFYANVLFPLGYDRLMKNAALEKKRQSLLSEAKGEVLEIGIGTGLNLPLYPNKVTSIAGIDPNPGMQKQLQKRLKELNFSLDFRLSGAEALPFEDNRFDTVVSTLVLCSIPKLDEALCEVVRVLRPGGKFVFIEHGMSCDAKVRRLQRWLNPIQKFFADGCQLTVPIGDKIANSMHIDKINEGYLESLPRTHGYLYSGVATKPH